MVVLENDQISISVDPLGAELLELKKIGHSNVLWKKNPAYWNRVAPNLFPIVGRLKNDSYFFQGKKYSMSQHGFARDLLFELVSRDSSQVIFQLNSNSSTAVKYPFEFEFSVVYSLQGNSVEISYITKNTGASVLPYSVGGHPGFEIFGQLSDYRIVFPESMKIDRHLLKGSYLSGERREMKIDEKLHLYNDLFSNDAIVFIEPPYDQLVLEHVTNGPLLTVRSTTWAAVGIWTKPGAPFLCIEPWWGWADRTDSNQDILAKPGIHLLEPGTEEVLSFSIELH